MVIPVNYRKFSALEWSLIFSCFAVWLPTALMTLSSFLILSSWLFNASRFKFTESICQPAISAPIILFASYALATLYSSAPFDISMHYCLKYSKLLLIPLIASAAISDNARKCSLNAFILGAILTLLVVYMKYLNLLPYNMRLHDHHYESIPHSFYAFKNSIAHGVIMSFALYIFLTKALFLKKKLNFYWTFLSIVAFFNIMYLGFSRTGQVIAILLIFFLMFKRFGKKFIFVSLLTILIALPFKSEVINFMPSKLTGINSELSQHQPDKHLTSAGERFEMYKTALQIIKGEPIFGSGVGSVEIEYSKITRSKNTLLKDVTNLHNQYLMTFVELGVVGFTFLIWMFYAHWGALNSLKMKNYEYKLYLKGLVMVIVTGSLFNSLILDAGEGKFYCILAGVLLSAANFKSHCKK